MINDVVLMFTLVRQVTVRKRLDWDGAQARWAAAIPGLIDGHRS